MKTTKYCQLADYQGCRAYVGRFNMPKLCSNRCYITVADHVRNYTDGSLILTQTSKGTEHLQSEYECFLKKAELAIYQFRVSKITPCDGGVEIHTAICFDMAGSFSKKMKWYVV